MTNAIIKFTEKKISDNNQLQQFINEARVVANVIFPETLPFSDKYCRLGVEIVTIDPANDKHVYQNVNGGFSLHLSKLNEIAKAAKIRVVGSRILERKTDEKGRVTFISHEVTVQYRTVSGEMISETYTGKYDYFNDLSTKSEKETKSRRKHAEALAESNALTRAFNKVLPQLPQSFNKSDFNKPFLIPYVEEDKNALLEEFSIEERKEIKKELARKKLGIIDIIYEAPQTTRGESKLTETKIEEATIVDETPSVVPGLSEKEKNKIYAEEMREAPQAERTEKILSLIKLKGWKHPQGTTITAEVINNTPLDRQITRIEELLNMKDEVLLWKT